MAEQVVTSAFLDTAAVADRYAVSRKHIFRLIDAGKIPQPLRIGHALRWRLSTLEQWESAGCPAPVARRVAK